MKKKKFTKIRENITEVEYQKLLTYFNFKEEDFKKMNITAIEASFLNEEEKSHLKALI